MDGKNRANLKKTIYYFKRNGIKETWYAVRERLEEKRQLPYLWTPPSETELENQRRQWDEKGFSVRFSILVPAYRTKPEYLKELVESLQRQTYPKWELILADASEDDSVERAVRKIVDLWTSETEETKLGQEPAVLSHGGRQADPRIRYIRLPRNAGIAENTNQALPYATGEYVGLLDHDDVLTENALYEMAAAIEEGRQRGCMPKLLYSDEDKCNGDRTEYYEPNYKEDFNLDLLLSNNYICHFLVMDRKLIRKLKFRREFEGAQDYDLVLRAVAELGMAGAGMTGNEAAAGAGMTGNETAGAAIVHIPKVLYHWRCHTGSTAENPRSKLYAYEAGRRALQDFAERLGWPASALETAHVGFYRLRYEGSLFRVRPDIGAIGGSLTKKGRIIGGRMAAEKGERGQRGYSVFYKDLPVHFSGYLHRAQLSQDAEALDLNNIQVRPECRELFRLVTGVTYREAAGEERFDASLLPEGCDIVRLSLELGRVLREAGYRLLYLPERSRELS